MSQFSINSLSGYSWQAAASIGIGTLDVGASVSYARSGKFGQHFVLGFGYDIGWSPLPVKVSGTAGYYQNRISNYKSYNWFLDPFAPKL